MFGWWTEQFAWGVVVGVTITVVSFAARARWGV